MYRNILNKKSYIKNCGDINMLDYTYKQLEAVQQLRRCKNYYEMLGVSKDATATDIRKAFRRQALIFHPDKNKAPGSDEAFKDIAKAFETLFDSPNRLLYDKVQTRRSSLFRPRRSPRSKRSSNKSKNRRHTTKPKPPPELLKFNDYLYMQYFSRSYSSEPEVSDKFFNNAYNRMSSETNDYATPRGAQMYLGMFLMFLIQLCCHFC